MREADWSCLFALSAPLEDAGHALRRASGGAPYELQAAEFLRSSFLRALSMLKGSLEQERGSWRAQRGFEGAGCAENLSWRR